MMQASARDRLEQALARIADPAGEGARACLAVYADSARAAADAADARARQGTPLGPLDGAIVSLKDLFDVRGEPTRAASKVLADSPPAESDAPIVQRLRAAGAVIVAKTNMSEFAFTGVGINPHFGTPANPADRTRVPGGSSSGAGVAVADRLCEIAIGSDTGGSVRIPSALCGVVGFKPSQYRVSRDGAFPLSYTLDSIGPLARSVAECAAADAVMAGEVPSPLHSAPVAGLRLGVPRSDALLPQDETVSRAFADALARLRGAGAQVSDEPIALIDRMMTANQKGGFAASEAYAIHRHRLEQRGGEVDPYIRMRIERGAAMSAADYVDLVRTRAELVRAMDAWLQDLDALVMPTTPIVAPTFAETQSPETFARKNVALLAHPTIANFFDLTAISLPLPRNGGLPVGLMLIARNGQDRRLLRMAAGVERLLATP